jgi:hypothetical protein
VIELRRKLDRGLRHPVLGPILLILLALLMAMTVLHAVQDGHDAATELGAICFAILTILGPVVLIRMPRQCPVHLLEWRRDRGPPGDRLGRTTARLFGTGPSFSSPLLR